MKLDTPPANIAQRQSTARPAPGTPAAPPLDAIGQQRVRESVVMARGLAWSFKRTRLRHAPIDDLIAEALYALVSAASWFDEKRGVPFGAYACVVIRHHLIQVGKRWRTSRRGRRRRAPANLGARDVAIRAPDAKRSAEAEAMAHEMCQRVREILPARTYYILWRYAAGHTLESIGASLGVSRQRVRQLMLRAKEQALQKFPEWSLF